ncbi:TetR/AcrR family transcriptional regulator [Streptomyces albipurpureus]|uniref:TetR/AcrR family transcriptional regulator n=1 Tax=Streptomyces albipurpureus TaxID=2897419 RepID=A0ABT0UZ53_9ACTN|nr:TetR/AcrR family transcriptional regulator [Streptomyces sp. CWNU-1]MCM2392426.1 TetR/AcrR family transcriptional regulator [Streptomyces sp. CWNU-1]
MANPYPETGTRSRTRRAILSAAAATLSRRRDATLAEISTAAEVGRSTLQRYYSERDELMAAVIEDSLRLLNEALKDARIEAGAPLEALRRLVSAMLDVSDQVLFLYGDPRISESIASADEPDTAGEDIRRLIRRGQDGGVLDPEVGADWIEHVLWAHVSAGCMAISGGDMPRHGASDQVIRTLENGIGAARHETGTAGTSTEGKGGS